MEIDTAREKLERVQGGEKSPYVLSRMALIADLDGDFGRADRLLRDAQRLDAQNFPLPRGSRSASSTTASNARSRAARELQERAWRRSRC
jgi:hypothetical protein